MKRFSDTIGGGGAGGRGGKSGSVADESLQFGDKLVFPRKGIGCFGTTGCGEAAHPFATAEITSGFEPTLAGRGVNTAASEGPLNGTPRDCRGAGDFSRRIFE